MIYKPVDSSMVPLHGVALIVLSIQADERTDINIQQKKKPKSPQHNVWETLSRENTPGESEEGPSILTAKEDATLRVSCVERVLSKFPQGGSQKGGPRERGSNEAPPGRPRNLYTLVQKGSAPRGGLKLLLAFNGGRKLHPEDVDGVVDA
ncbi:hypothetical protein KM043_016262 [Ampulex compressa]|nr:hypothetical protein KM043_016262 [Ampulex compressa]